MEFWARVSSPDESSNALRCAGTLTPYSMETIGQHAVLAGPGARVHVVVPTGASDATVSWVRKRLDHACRHRAEVSVRRGSQPA